MCLLTTLRPELVWPNFRRMPDCEVSCPGCCWSCPPNDNALSTSLLESLLTAKVEISSRYWNACCGAEEQNSRRLSDAPVIEIGARRHRDNVQIKNIHRPICDIVKQKNKNITDGSGQWWQLCAHAPSLSSSLAAFPPPHAPRWEGLLLDCVSLLPSGFPYPQNVSLGCFET